MINFIDIENGKTFNGEPPYVHWFNDCCSTNLIYNKPICFISDIKLIQIELNSPIFFLIDTLKIKTENTEIINGFEYQNINSLKSNEIISVGEKYEKFYIHLIYVGAISKIEAEFIDDLFIYSKNSHKKLGEYKIGFRAYDNNEINDINLSNLGIDIPPSIQRSIYSTNVHEDLDDNILLNRKWKELLTNYWDVVANCGSYKSAINSLKWFEWGDLLKIREFWKLNEPANINKIVLEERELHSIMKEKYKKSLCVFAKTTYWGLYVTMQELTGEYDRNKNPIIEQITTKWSKTDLMLKLSLLNNFYETYFLPIHIDLLHCTIEDIVFTDVFKIINGTINNREDNIYDTSYIKCNIKDNETFILTNANAQVGKNTIFGTQYNDENNYEDIKIVGIGETNEDGQIDDYIHNLTDEEVDDDAARTFFSQHYNHIGVVIPVNIKIDISENYKKIGEKKQYLDFIKHGILCINKADDNWLQRETHKIFKPDEKGIINIDFKILCNKEGEYDLRLQFISGGGRSYTSTVKFNVADISNSYLKLYKIKRLDKKLDSSFMNNPKINDYIMGRTDTPDIIQCFLTYPKRDGDGIALNNVLVFKQEYVKEDELIDLPNTYKWIRREYMYYNKNVDEPNMDPNAGYKIRYTICISKTYWYDPTEWLAEYGGKLKKYVFRNFEYYFPELHKLDEISGNNLNDYIISEYDSICIIPLFKTRNGEIPFKYGKNLDLKDSEWEVVNVSTNESIKLPSSIKEPYMPRVDTPLPSGYYNIIFKYKIGDKTGSLRLNSAFLKK